MNWYLEHTLTVEDLRVANYMIDHDSEMIGIQQIPEKLSDARMIFRSENVHTVYGQAMSINLPDLTPYETDRISGMIALLSCVKQQELDEEAEA